MGAKFNANTVWFFYDFLIDFWIDFGIILDAFWHDKSIRIFDRFWHAFWRLEFGSGGLGPPFLLAKSHPNCHVFLGGMLAPKIIPKASQNSSKIYSKFHQKINRFFYRFLFGIWCQKSSQPMKNRSRTLWFFDRFFDTVLDWLRGDIWPSRPLIFVLSPGRRANNHIFSILEKLWLIIRFLKLLGFIFPSPFLLKWLPNFLRKISEFGIDVGIDFGSIFVTKIHRKSHQKSFRFLDWFWSDF